MHHSHSNSCVHDLPHRSRYSTRDKSHKSAALCAKHKYMQESCRNQLWSVISLCALQQGAPFIVQLKSFFNMRSESLRLVCNLCFCRWVQVDELSSSKSSGSSAPGLHRLFHACLSFLLKHRIVLTSTDNSHTAVFPLPVVTARQVIGSTWAKLKVCWLRKRSARSQEQNYFLNKLLPVMPHDSSLCN